MDPFFFGTLRDRDMLELVLGRPVGDHELDPATLSGYRLVHVADEDYPTLVACPDGRVDGVLVRGLTARDAERIRWFEGGEYAGRPCPVTRWDGAVETALVEFPAESLEVGDTPWDFGAWQERSKPLMLAMTRAHMDLLGRATAAEAEAAWNEALPRMRAAFAAEGAPRRRAGGQSAGS